MSYDKCTTITGHFRTLYRFGFHPTATRAAMLLRTHFSGHRTPTTNAYQICPFTTETVLSFCIDTTQVLVADITDNDSDFSSGTARTCLVVDDTPQNNVTTATVWSATSPPLHFIFASMFYDRALDWVRRCNKNAVMRTRGISMDMHRTYSDCDIVRWPRTLMNYDHYDDHREFLTCLIELTMSCNMSATSISDHFLQDCTRLTFLDTVSLTNVSQIGDNFLYGCSSLMSLDLSPLANVSQIGDYFLYDCSSLMSLDLSPLANVGNYFLCHCCSLTSLDLSPLANVSRIGDYFLFRCSSLTSLDLSPLANVSRIGDNFLFRCSSLTSLDLSPLANVSQIGDYFLYDCLSLTSLGLSPLANVSRIGNSFLCECFSLTSLDLSPLANVSQIGDFFLCHCFSLTSLDLSPLAHARIGMFCFFMAPRWRDMALRHAHLS